MADLSKIEELGARRESLRIELAGVTEELRVASVAAHKDGSAEAAVARAAKVDRMTMRKWLGK